MPDVLDDAVTGVWSRAETAAKKGLDGDDVPKASQYAAVEVESDPTPYRVFGLLTWSSQAGTPHVRQCDASSVACAYELTISTDQSYTHDDLRESAEVVGADVEQAARRARTAEMEFVVAQLTGPEMTWKELPKLQDDFRGGRLIVREQYFKLASKLFPRLNVEKAPPGFPLRALLLPVTGGPELRRLVSDFSLLWRRTRVPGSPGEDRAEFVLAERFFLLNPAGCRRLP